MPYLVADTNSQVFLRYHKNFLLDKINSIYALNLCDATFGETPKAEFVYRYTFPSDWHIVKIRSITHVHIIAKFKYLKVNSTFKKTYVVVTFCHSGCCRIERHVFKKHKIYTWEGYAGQLFQVSLAIQTHFKTLCLLDNFA